MDDKKTQWEASYEAGHNFVFYPHEEVIRFTSKYVRRRIALDRFEDRSDFGRQPRWLDLGCGIGRHVIFGHEYGADVYGIDLSETAVTLARDWATKSGISGVESRICQGSVAELPWDDGFFDVVVSHGVLDSMPFQVAQAAVGEVVRTLASGGFFYCDLVSGDDSDHSPDFSGEEIVQTEHEHDTIQSYFSFSRIEEWIGGRMEIVECRLIRITDVLTGAFISRYHLVLKKP